MKVLNVAVLLTSAVLALSSPVHTHVDRGLVDGLVDGVIDTLDATVSILLEGLNNATKAGDKDAVLDIFGQIKPTKTLGSVEEVSAILEIIATSSPSTIINLQGQLLAHGVISTSIPDPIGFARGSQPGNGSSNNHFRNRDPPHKVYPKLLPCDAKYTESEAALRSAIHIPKSFTYGKKPPVILFPGTGATGYVTFMGNFIPLLSGTAWADPVWVNVPQFLLADAQVNAEFAAYAINYIASLTKRDVSVIAWSQGNINLQWAYKYWPSTRKVTEDHVAISADYRGTVMANVADITGITNDPSVVQQAASSNFINALRGGDGGSAFVPTTSIYSGFFDEIVEPQSGPNASAILEDARGVGVTNAEAQVVCKGEAAGGFYTHEGMLANPLSYALAKDALTHKGPGKLDRLDLRKVCSTLQTEGLGLEDFLLTENAILFAGVTTVAHVPKVADEEPKLKSYAVEQAARSC